jgi:hypothetical protein
MGFTTGMKTKASLYIAIAIFFIAVILADGCSPKQVPLEDRHATDDLVIIPDHVFEEEKALKCDLNGVLYYIKGHFIYHINNRGDEIVLSPVGDYTKESGYPRWALRMYADKESSVYVDTLGWISERKFPNNEPIECVYTNAIPKSFEKFYAQHEQFFVNETKSALEDADAGEKGESVSL